MKHRTIATLGATLLLGCSEGALVVEPAPLPAATGGAAGRAQSTTPSKGGSSATGGAAGAAGSSGPVIRTVTTRAPFGNLEKGNLLWDGDLEWTGPFVSQYSWVAATPTGPGGGFGGGDITVLVGPACRSGLKCAALTVGGLAAIGVAPKTPFTHARAWVRVPPTVACADVSVRIEGCFFEAVGAAPLDPGSAKPDATGWCRFEGDRPTPDDAICMYFVRPGGVDGDFVVDDAFAGEGAAAKAQRTFDAPRPEVIADIRRMQAAVRERVQRLPPATTPPAFKTRR